MADKKEKNRKKGSAKRSIIMDTLFGVDDEELADDNKTKEGASSLLEGAMRFFGMGEAKDQLKKAGGKKKRKDKK